VLLATKVQAPALRHALVERSELVGRLSSGPPRRITLVGAPPGWGKTTLLCIWSVTDERQFAWVALDDGDNDPARLWTYVAEALRRIDGHLGADAIAALGRRGADIEAHVLPALLNELAALPDDVVLVLDDYHVITNPAIHRQVAYLVDRLPPRVELALASRTDPPLPLGRLRARRELLEIRAADLRFSREETAALMNDLLGLGLEERAVSLLQQRTEGWAAGLQLAALSLEGGADRSQFVEQFAGDDRHIVDYLGFELLDRQPDDVRSFLLRTSVLGRLSAPLCKAVTGTQRSAAMLAEIERANLFLVALDEKREWYRYHHLFGDLLRHELAATEPELVAELHRRAARWYSEHGVVEDAFEHTLAAGDVGGAADLVAGHWSTTFNHGRLATVEHWLDSLPPEAVAGDPRLALARAWIAADQGRLGEMGRWLEVAEKEAAASHEVGGEVVILQAVDEFKRGDVGGALRSAKRALALEPAESPLGLAVAYSVLGLSLFWSGRIDEAEPQLRNAARLAPRVGNELARIYSLGYLALIQAERRQPRRAVRLAAQALGHEPQLDHFVAMVAHLALARAHDLEGRLEEAESAGRRALELARKGAGLIELSASLARLAAIRERQGDSPEAQALRTEARLALDRCPDPGTAATLVEQRRHGHAETSGDGLSDRELAVLQLLPTDLSQREIGARLFVSLNTVKSHTRAIYRKLDASNRDEAVARAREAGLV
jgi:LuxR family maltose regulon positive regulatory protein